MEMTNDLPSLPASINYDAVPGLNSIHFGHPFGSEKHFAPNIRRFLVEGVERIEVPFRDDQKVNGSLRVDVFKNDKLFVFIDDVGRQCMGDNLAEYAGHPLHPLKLINSSSPKNLKNIL